MTLFHDTVINTYMMDTRKPRQLLLRFIQCIDVKEEKLDECLATLEKTMSQFNELIVTEFVVYASSGIYFLSQELEFDNNVLSTYLSI
eukprot:Awhi_evm2s14438